MAGLAKSPPNEKGWGGKRIGEEEGEGGLDY